MGHINFCGPKTSLSSEITLTGSANQASSKPNVLQMSQA